ncbi:extracellular solute-binding protein [Umezawaea sp. Da 62-37]|uniref:sugar ABC transporter substrate-binding protein n=1 Tax=Umezawaea sp. Da 62-37 TaxID=3075927 RepID=UPI0028F745FA|nr:extracellular solute-binding protein [Umezawaea sp. Da 62-37]WNV87202.1 extracellular solute-binding protein [Umezawaea sp. Da 62-37]
MAIGWGEFPDWISAFGSVFALVFAASAVVVTRRTYRIESDRDHVNAALRERQQELMRQGQATAVSAWWGESEDGNWGAFVRNASGAPVYQVFLTVLDSDDRSDGAKFHFLVVPPSDKAVFCPAAQRWSAGRTSVHRVKLCFTDVTGVRWQRNQYGRISELEPALHVKSDSVRALAVARFKDDFQATYGVHVTFDTSSLDLSQASFVDDLERAPEVDALVCPHDWIGDLLSRGLIEPTLLADHHRELFQEWTLSALTMNGRLYGLPTTVDTVALFRNVELAPSPPSTFDELIAHGAELKSRGRVDEALAVRIGENGDPFQIWPLFTSAGGTLFGRRGSTGLGGPGSIRAFEKLRELGESGLSVLRRSMDAQEAFDLFARGRTPYLITSSDAFAHVSEHGVPFAITAVPGFADGGPAQALSLVHGFVVTSKGPNRIIAHDLFADYLTHEHVMSALSQSIGAPNALRGVPSADAGLKAFYDLCELGQPMPADPCMRKLWRILERAELAAVSGVAGEVVAQEAAIAADELLGSM